MPNKKAAKIDIAKAIAGVSFATLTAIGGSSGHPLLAGIAAIPAAGLAAHNALSERRAKLKSQKEKYLEIPSPFWWTSDFQSWQNLCSEVENHLPQILFVMQESMQREEQVMTRNRVREIFIEAFADQYLMGEPDVEQKKRIGEYLANPILEKTDEVLQPVIEHIQHEQMLIDERRTAEHTEHTVEVLEKMHEHMISVTQPHVLDDEEIAYLRKGYNTVLFTDLRMLDFRGIMRVDMNRPISIPLTDVFILPDVLSGVPEYETLERELEELRYGSHARKAKLSSNQRESLRSVLAKHSRLVILGDPGSGKSTLLKYLVLQLVQGSDTFATTFPEMSDCADLVPLHIRLSAFAEVLLSHAPGTRSLEDFLPVYFHDNYLGTYIHYIQTQLDRGKLFVLFDGLDEIPDASLRMNVVRHIEMFTQTYAANRFIVTSRIVGYKEVPLSSEYQPFTLADFNEEQVKTFTQLWCPAYERWVNGTSDSRSLEDAATKEADKLFYATQCKPAVKRLAVNPLLLTILALIQRQGIELPSHRVELFELCAMTLIDTWVKAKGQSTRFSKNELIKILRPLAFWMHQHPAVGNIPGEELHEQIVKQLTERSINEYEASKLAEQFLETVRGKTGILVERGKDRYGFLHLTFEEYFAAKELEKYTDRNDFIKNHLHHPRWREVILLTVGAIGILQSNEEEVTELVHTTIAKAGSLYEWALHRDLLFAGHCLADDVGIRVDCEDEVIERIVYLALTSPYEGFRRTCSSVFEAWGDTRIGKKALDLVLPLLYQWVTANNSQKTFNATTPFEKKLAEHIEQQAMLYQKEMTRHLRFQLTIILAQLGTLEGVDWVSNLLGLLSDENERAKALNIYKEDDQLSIFDILLLVLSDPDKEVKKKAISALGYLGATDSKIIDTLLLSLPNNELDLYRTAIKAFERLGEPQPRIIEALLITLSEHPNTKESAIKALWKLDPENPHVIDAMLLTLVDVDGRRLRQAGANALIHLQTKDHTDSIEAALATISNPTTEAKERLASLLAQLSSNPDRAAAILSSSFTSSNVAKEVALRTLAYLGRGQAEVTNALLTFIAGSNEDIREAAINALGQRDEREPMVIDALISMLSDSSWLIKYEGIKALERLGISESHVVDALISACSDSYAYIRGTVIDALGKLEQIQPSIHNVFLSAINDSHARVRIAAATALGRQVAIQPLILDTLISALIGFNEFASEESFDSLVQLCMDQPNVANYLVNALSQIANNDLVQRAQESYMQRLYECFIERTVSLIKDVGSYEPSTIDKLFSIISDYDFSEGEFHIRLESSRALGNIGKKESTVIDNLLSALNSSNRHLRQAVVRAFGQLDKGPPRVIDALITALSDPNEEVRGSSASSLGKLGKANPRVSSALLHALFDPDSGTVRQSAALALGQIGEGLPDIFNALLQTLCETSWWGKYGATNALRKLGKGPSDFVDALITMLSSPDVSTRSIAARALGFLDEKRPEHIEALLSLLSDPYWPVREEVARALGELDEKLSRSSDALLHILSDSSSSVRYSAAYALRNGDDGNKHTTKTLLHALSDSDWGVRGAAAYALANSHKDVEVIGAPIEELLRHYEPIAHRELRDYNLVFDALRVSAEKI
jgi:HEAT repeat protein